MMIKPFRKYRCIVDWIDKEKCSKESCESVINLFSVAEWSTLDNEYFGFNDSHKRTAVTFHEGHMYKVRVPFEEFDRTMTQFLGELKLLDERSMYGPPGTGKSKNGEWFFVGNN